MEEALGFIRLDRERGIALLERCALDTRELQAARAELKEAIRRVRAARFSMRMSNKKLRDYLSGRDDGQLSLPLLSVNGHAAA